MWASHPALRDVGVGRTQSAYSDAGIAARSYSSARVICTGATTRCISQYWTFNVPVNALFEAWADDATRRRWLDGVEAAVRTATRPKSIRLQWPDGTIVAVWFTAKSDAKSAVALVHTKLRDSAASADAKKYWTHRLDALASVFGTRIG